ncbi:Mss4-like protein [Apodospora peruviana]|uniref:Mss4-like protein n=1 Tax=Apodospora peruviana TaxID=516989 RepID=A0AAE0I5V7_9PEZI|nr:Mss4-like protein [Apodospora peruviana]
MSTTRYEGKCLCGGIRFTISSEPSFVGSCYCLHCIKGSGGVNQVVGRFSKKDVKIEAGEDLITTYVFTDTSTGKGKDKTFCKTCGAPLWTVPESARKSDELLIRTALLENGSEIKPKVAIFTRTRASWVPSIEGVPDFETMPPPPPAA